VMNKCFVLHIEPILVLSLDNRYKRVPFQDRLQMAQVLDAKFLRAAQALISGRILFHTSGM
jgi:hypothetical protein